MNPGVIGIAWAPVCDWAFKSVLTRIRYKNGKWKMFKII